MAHANPAMHHVTATASDPQPTSRRRFARRFAPAFAFWSALWFADGVFARQGDEQQIRARREASNQAIARHDTSGIGSILTDDVVVVTSNSVHRSGREANEQSFAEQFRTRPDVVYRRTPAEVMVFAPWQMASESGTWTGSWTDPDGKIQLTGRYFAKWRKLKGQWFVESETYVPETCTGGAYCTRVP